MDAVTDYAGLAELVRAVYPLGLMGLAGWGLHVAGRGWRAWLATRPWKGA